MVFHRGVKYGSRDVAHPPYGHAMTERLPSLNLLLELIQAERDKQLKHFDALDNKAGIVLGFGGLLITLAPDVTLMFRLPSLLAAVVAAGFALAAFWPRRFPVLEPTPLRTYLRADDAFTRLTVHDTLEELVNEGSEILQVKGRRLGYGLWALTTAVVGLASGIVFEAL
jgi:hypothetical protein